MQIRPLRVHGAFEIIYDPRQDERGYFMRAYDRELFEEHCLVTDWVQENEAYSKHEGVIRGLHFQKPPHAETKFVRVARGAVLDAFVDIRSGSPTFGEWDAVELSAERHNAVYIPKGCAHGYCTLSADSLVLYKVDSYYAPSAEGGLLWNDPSIGIPWPVSEPIMSAKDKALPKFIGFDSPFV